MPNIKSAKKRVSVIKRRRQENRYVKSTISTLIKNFKATVKVDVNKAENMLNDIVSYIYSAESKGVIHKNNASRKVSRLNTLLFKAKNDSKTTEVVETPVEKEEVKEEAPKKATRKKATKKVEE